jgi:hypothetical protein
MIGDAPENADPSVTTSVIRVLLGLPEKALKNLLIGRLRFKKLGILSQRREIFVEQTDNFPVIQREQ